MQVAEGCVVFRMSVSFEGSPVSSSHVTELQDHMYSL